MMIITGVSGGIGSSLYKHYVEKEEDLIGVYNKTKTDLPRQENLYQLDIRDFRTICQLFKQLEGKLSDIVLVNAAGVHYDAFAHKSDADKWKEVIDINLTGTFNMIRAVLPTMRKQSYGRIINLSSVVTERAVLGTSAYSASKSGLHGLVKTLALENASMEILVNNLCLGYMEKGMTNSISGHIKGEILNSIPLKRFGPVIDIIQAIDFLVNATYVTGTTIHINGGLY